MGAVASLRLAVPLAFAFLLAPPAVQAQHHGVPKEPIPLENIVTSTPLYATDGRSLYHLHIGTGQLAKIADLDPQPHYFAPQLSYDRTHHFLYALAPAGGGGDFYTIDKDTAAMQGPFSVQGIPANPPVGPSFYILAFAYNPWNDHIYAAGLEGPLDKAHLLDVDLSTWQIAHNSVVFENADPFRGGAFDEWTGYLLFRGGQQGAPRLIVLDPGTGHVPGSLETYPIPTLDGYYVYSLSVHPQTADVYFIGNAYADPFGTGYRFYRTDRSSGQVSLIADVSNGPVQIAFGEPVHLGP